jgi:hypothetical protein
VHAAWSIVQLACLGRIWLAVVGRRRDPAVWGSVALLAAEGAALVVGRGSCPMGSLQARWGDPVPFFELLLPPRAAKAAVPVLFAVSLAAIAGLVARAPGLRLRAGRAAPGDSRRQRHRPWPG